MKPNGMMGHLGPLLVRLYKRTTQPGFGVSIAAEEENWDYEDEADVRELSQALRLARTWEEAIEVMGWGDVAGEVAP